MTVVRGEGCPRPFFFFLADDWLMLLSGHRVPREDEEPCVICGGFYKQRRAWKWWGWDPGQRPKWEIHQECIPFLSSPLFFLSLSSLRVWKNSCCYNSTVQIFLQSYMQRLGAQAVRQVAGSEVWRWGASPSNILNTKANGKQQTPLHAQCYMVKRATSSWQMNK